MYNKSDTLHENNKGMVTKDLNKWKAGVCKVIAAYHCRL